MTKDFMSINKEIQSKLIESNIINESQMKQALKTQEENGESLANILVNLNYIKQEHLLKFTSQVVGIPYVKLEKSLVDPDVLKLVPENLVTKYNLIPVLKLADTLTVALTDPFNLYALDELRFVTGLEIEPLLCDESDFRDVMKHFYTETDFGLKKDNVTPAMEPKSSQPRVKKGGEPAELSTEIRLTETSPDFGLISDGDDHIELEEKARQDKDRSPVIKITNLVLRQAIKQGASDVHIEPQREKLHIRYRIDGVLQTAHVLPRELGRLLVSRIKIMSRLNISERRLPQDGVFTVRFGEKEIDGRVATTPTVYGESAIIRLLNQSKGLIDVDNMGLSVELRSKFRKIIRQNSGFILVTGPTGSGKTTTLYAALNDIQSDKLKIVTIEDPIEYRVQGLSQIQVYHHIGLDFSKILRSVLRQDPDIILVGEVNDKETAQVAVQAVLAGHLLFSTLHATSSINSIIRLMDLGIEYFYIREVLSLVIAQRLVRKLCLECRELYSPTEQELDEDGLRMFTAEDKIYRSAGCNSCGNTGFSGRIPLFEMLFMTDDVKNVLKTDTDRAELYKAARNAGMTTLWESAIEAVKNGVTSLHEIKANIPRV
jgi:type IV pilus assembly protein PilB